MIRRDNLPYKEAIKLAPNPTGFMTIPIDRDDAQAGFVMVEDWNGKTHRIPVRLNEGGTLSLPVPKLGRANG